MAERNILIMVLLSIEDRFVYHLCGQWCMRSFIVVLRLSKKVGGEAQNLGGDFGGESVLSLGETLGERP